MKIVGFEPTPVTRRQVNLRSRALGHEDLTVISLMSYTFLQHMLYKWFAANLNNENYSLIE